MATYDPVKPEFLLTYEQVEPFIPPEYIGGGFTTAPDLSLAALTDATPAIHRKLLFLKQRGTEAGGGVDGLFSAMHDVVLERVGRHMDQLVAAACLYPDREAPFDLVTVSSVFMEACGSLEPDLLSIRMVLGDLGMNALMNLEENETAVQAGQFFHYV